MVTLDAVRWLVGEEDGGGNFLWWNPSDFFLFGGVEYRVIFKALKWTLGDLFFSEWKFVQYGCRVGYFARDSMKTEQSQPQQLLQNYVYIYDICIEVEIIDFSTNSSQKAYKHMQNIFFWHLTRVAF